MFGGFFSRFKSRMLANWFREAAGGSKEDIQEIVVPGGRFYFVPDDGREMPVITTMFKSLADETPPLPDRTKVVMIMAPAGSDVRALKVEFLDQTPPMEEVVDDGGDVSLAEVAEEICDLAEVTAGRESIAASASKNDDGEEVVFEMANDIDREQEGRAQSAMAGTVGGDVSQRPY